MWQQVFKGLWGFFKVFKLILTVFWSGCLPSLFFRLLETVPKVIPTISITIPFKFYRFFCLFLRSKYLSIFSDYLISNFSSLLSKPLGTFSILATIISITVTFIYLRFFCTLARSKYLPIFSFSYTLLPLFALTAKSTKHQIIFFLFNNTRFLLLARIRWSVCISKFQRIFNNRF